jgi:hypothetical protein
LLDKADSNQDHDTADSLTPRTSQSFGICRTTRTGQIQTTTKWSPARKAKGPPQQRLRISSGTSEQQITIHENREVPSWLSSSVFIVHRERHLQNCYAFILIPWYTGNGVTTHVVPSSTLLCYWRLQVNTGWLKQKHQ